MEIENNILINELQLGVKLGECIQSERRSDFSLMLAMLTDDVKEHSQFKLPVVEEDTSLSDDLHLRKKFNLPQKIELAIKDLSEINNFSQAQHLTDGAIPSIHLENVLQPKPLSLHNDKRHIPSNILTNCTLHCQNRYQNVGNKSAQRLNFNINSWLDGIQASIVNAPLTA
ncbi:MAG: hypothetical protein MJK12_12765 [Colwellia sp.]|nr:hypothetical protein [Colwellia sp.]